MAVTKRTRFEVLRRDGHTCRYCHATDSPLTVDHVVPVALGGSDDPSNLVACCRDCNSGKGSSNPDAGMVASVAEDALRHAQMIKQAYAVIAASADDKEEYLDEFIEAWPDEYIFDGWRGSVAEFWRMGIPIEMLLDALDTARSKNYVRPGAPRFKYMCGVLWKQIETVTDEARIRHLLNGAWVTQAVIDDRICEAYDVGFKAGYARCREAYAGSDFEECECE